MKYVSAMRDARRRDRRAAISHPLRRVRHRRPARRRGSSMRPRCRRTVRRRLLAQLSRAQPIAARPGTSMTTDMMKMPCRMIMNSRGTSVSICSAVSPRDSTPQRTPRRRSRRVVLSEERDRDPREPQLRLVVRHAGRPCRPGSAACRPAPRARPRSGTASSARLRSRCRRLARSRARSPRLEPRSPAACARKRNHTRPRGTRSRAATATTGARR